MAYTDIVNWFYVGMTYLNNTYLLRTDVTHMYLENVIIFFLFKSLSLNKTAINMQLIKSHHNPILNKIYIHLVLNVYSL